MESCSFSPSQYFPEPLLCSTKGWSRRVESSRWTALLGIPSSLLNSMTPNSRLSAFIASKRATACSRD